MEGAIHKALVGQEQLHGVTGPKTAITAPRLSSCVLHRQHTVCSSNGIIRIHHGPRCGRLRLVRAVLAGDPDPPVWSGGPGKVHPGLIRRSMNSYYRSRTNGNEQFVLSRNRRSHVHQLRNIANWRISGLRFRDGKAITAKDAIPVHGNASMA